MDLTQISTSAFYLQYFGAPILTGLFAAYLGHKFKSRQDKESADTKYRHQYHELILNHRVDAYLALRSFVTKYSKKEGSRVREAYPLRDVDSWDSVFSDLEALEHHYLWFTNSSKDALSTLAGYLSSISHHYGRPDYLDLGQLHIAEMYIRKLSLSIANALPSLGDIDTHFDDLIRVSREKARTPVVADDISGSPMKPSSWNLPRNTHGDE